MYEFGVQSSEYLVLSPNSELNYSELQIEVEMAEAVQESLERGHVTRKADTSFEPEILAFCCEH